jgi:hypothetical protein
LTATAATRDTDDQKDREALALTKAAHAQVQTAISGENDDRIQTEHLLAWKRALAIANVRVTSLRRRLAREKAVAKAERALMQEAMRGDLVDREAHHALLAERMHAVVEDDGGGGGASASVGRAFDRACSSAQQIEELIGRLAPHMPSDPSYGTLVMERHLRS